jgi:hypothetical protein
MKRRIFLLALSLACCPAPAQTSQWMHEQLAAERHAKLLLARPAVQQEIAALETKWRQRWPSLRPSTLQQARGSLEELAFLVATETVNNDPRRPEIVQISMPPHRWFGEQVPGGRWGIDNPDTQYFMMPVEAESAYVITGKRAPHGPADVNVSFGNLERWSTIANLGKNQLAVEADGSYTITLDTALVSGRKNHIQLTHDGNCILIRNTLADWNTDTIDRMTVRRVAGPDPLAAADDAALERAAIERLRSILDRAIDTLQAPVLALPVNFLPQPGKTGDKAGFLATQRNALGHFRLANDEALVITIEPGGAGYSAVPVTNVWGVSPDYWRLTTSLNNRQAVPNADGSFTVVVAGWDPSVANWVNTAGLEEGTVMLRWQVLPGAGSGSAEPAVRSTLVKREQLAAALPPSMVFYDSKQRAQQIKKRKEGFARRLAGR